MIIIKDSNHFFRLQRKFKMVPFSQSKGWYLYTLKKKLKIRFFIDSEDDIKIACWGVEHSIPMTKMKILKIEGECFHPNINEKEISKFYSKMVKLPFVGFEVNSNRVYNVKFELGLRLAGFMRPISFFSCPLTIELNLNEDFRFNNNWKGNIRKGLKNGLLFTELKDFNKEELIQICEMFRQMANLKGLSFYLKPESLEDLLLSNDVRTFIVYNQENKALAASIIYVDKPFSTNIFLANSNSGREYGASHFLVNKILKTLKVENFDYFDFGRIPPSNHSTNGIYQFKKGIRGSEIQYNGEWSYYKNSFIEGLINLYKRYFLKQQRY